MINPSTIPIINSKSIFNKRLEKKYHTIYIMSYTYTCPQSPGMICLSNIIVYGLIALLLIAIIYIWTRSRRMPSEEFQAPSCKPCAPCPKSEPCPKPVVIDKDYVDPILKVDYIKVDDPLVEPTRRLPRYALPPDYLAQVINVPTRGWPENFQLMGSLVRIDPPVTATTPIEEKILRLFGRQTYPGSNQYEYYVMIPGTGVKLPIRQRYKKELFTDDVVTIKELNAQYKVNMYKFDAPLYNPYAIYY
jgi:hypothetical protein